jgi:nitrate/nitrite-specific signal transduction histidine kinase
MRHIYIYHRSYIEEALNDTRKRLLYQKSQPARTARHSRWETEMILRRIQKEEQATETEITIYETEQQQEHEIRNDKKMKKTTKPNHTAEWIHARMADTNHATRWNRRT